MKPVHFPDAQVFHISNHPLFQLGDIRRVKVTFELTEPGKWLRDQLTDAHRIAESQTGVSLYRVVYDCATHQTMLMIFDKSIATAFKLAFA